MAKNRLIMKVTRKSILTGKMNTLDLNITQDQLDRHDRGYLVQDVFPHLSADEREFLITGIVKDEWDRVILSWDGNVCNDDSVEYD
jgi:hypothetical protein